MIAVLMATCLVSQAIELRTVPPEVVANLPELAERQLMEYSRYEADIANHLMDAETRLAAAKAGRIVRGVGSFIYDPKNKRYAFADAGRKQSMIDAH